MYDDVNDVATPIPASDFISTMGADAHVAWPLAMVAIAEATARPTEEVRAFLDSRWGGHFAVHVTRRAEAGQSLMDAVHASVATSMAWRMRDEPSDQGISHGTACLTAFVMLAARMEGQAAASME